MREGTARDRLSRAAAGKGLSCAAAAVILCLCVTCGYGFDTGQLDQARKTNRCEACDLSGADFTRAIMNDARLAGAKMAGAKMTGADLSSANLSGRRPFRRRPVTGRSRGRQFLEGEHVRCQSDREQAFLGQAHGRRLVSGANLTGVSLPECGP